MPSLRCLISALTQAGGGDLLFRFASSVQSCYGEGGVVQADVAVYGEHSPCSGLAARYFGGVSPGVVSLFLPWRAARAVRGLCSVSTGAACLFPPLRVAQAARGLEHSPRVRRAFSLRGPRMCRRSGLRNSLDRNRWPVCRVGGGGFSGAEFATFPSPRPPTSSGDGAALLCGFSVPLYCEPQVVCSGRLIFPCCPTV